MFLFLLSRCPAKVSFAIARLVVQCLCFQIITKKYFTTLNSELLVGSKEVYCDEDGWLAMSSYAGGPTGSEEDPMTDPPEDALAVDKASLVRVIGRKEEISPGLLVVDDDGEVEGSPLFVPNELAFLSRLRSAMVEMPSAGRGNGRGSDWSGKGVFGSKSKNEI